MTLNLIQDPEEQRASHKQNDVDHEEILDNFDAFIKLAGTELLQLKDVAKNISGMACQPRNYRMKFGKSCLL